MSWNEDLITLQKVSKYYETDCLQNCVLLFMYSLTVKLVKNNHVLARIFFIFLKNVLKQTGNFFNTMFQPQWKDWKNNSQLRQILGLFLPINSPNFRLKQGESPESYQYSQRNYVWRGQAGVRAKKTFPETINHKISETNSSFYVK